MSGSVIHHRPIAYTFALSNILLHPADRAVILGHWQFLQPDTRIVGAVSTYRDRLGRIQQSHCLRRRYKRRVRGEDEAKQRRCSVHILR